MLDLSYYLDRGYSNALRALEPYQARDLLTIIDNDVLPYDGPDIRARTQSRHLDSTAVAALCTSTPIIEAVRKILGPRLVLWRSNIFNKLPGAPELEWHRDASVWRDILTPMINVTAWVALTSANLTNGCIEFLPGSHRLKYGSERVDRPYLQLPHAVSEKKISISLEPGEFVLFDSATMHRSGPNISNDRRLGIAIRFTVPAVEIRRDHRLFDGYRTIHIGP